MGSGEGHYEELLEAYRAKYWSEEDGDLGEEQTEVDSNSVFTDSFRESFRSEEKENIVLLDNLIAEVNKFAKLEDDYGEEYSEEMKMVKSIEEKQKKRILSGQDGDSISKMEGEEVKEDDKQHLAEEAEEVEEEGLLQEDVLDEIEGETTSLDTELFEELEKREALRASKANKDLLAKRAYVYQALDSLIPEYEEELNYYVKEGETMLLAEDLPFILQSFGANPTEAESRDIVREFSKTDGRVAFIDFLVLLADHMAKAYTPDDVVEAFRIIDFNDNGEIPVSVLREVLTSIGEKLTEVEIEELINEGDPQQEGVVKYESLVRRMERNKYVAIPAKRKALIKILRKEDRRKKAKNLEEVESTEVPEESAEPEEEVDPLFGMLG